jgi:hypothetical protein
MMAGEKNTTISESTLEDFQKLKKHSLKSICWCQNPERFEKTSEENEQRHNRRCQM